jgi:hypothetical protein
MASDRWRNVGIGHRLILVAVGLLATSLTVIGPASWWGLIGLVPLAGGLWGW